MTYTQKFRSDRVSLQLTTAEYIRKSLIASYIGNIVGAAFVWVPYTYFYLGDYHADTTGLRRAEEGETVNEVGVVGNDVTGAGSDSSLRKREA